MSDSEMSPAERVLESAQDAVEQAEHEVSLEADDRDDARGYGELPAAERAEYDQAQAADIEHVRRTGELPWDDEFVFGGVTYGPDMIVEDGDVRAKTAAEIAADEEYRRPVYAELDRHDEAKETIREVAREAAERQRRESLSPQERTEEKQARERARADWDAWLDSDDDAAGM